MTGLLNPKSSGKKKIGHFGGDDSRCIPTLAMGRVIRDQSGFIFCQEQFVGVRRTCPNLLN